MTLYLVYPILKDATDKSRVVYLAKCKVWSPDNVTTHWFGIIEKRDPDDPDDKSEEAALVIPDGDENVKDYAGATDLLSVAEKTALKTEAELKLLDWPIDVSTEVKAEAVKP